ncbi:MAG TPA: hypothetical protein VIT91_06715 [Chthoniobacterales bacterium]
MTDLLIKSHLYLLIWSPLLLAGTVLYTLAVAPRGRRLAHFRKATLCAAVVAVFSLSIVVGARQPSSNFGWGSPILLLPFLLSYWGAVGFSGASFALIILSPASRKWLSLPPLLVFASLTAVSTFRHGYAERTIASDRDFWRTQLQDSRSIPLEEMRRHLSAEGRHVAGLMIESDREPYISVETLETLRTLGFDSSVARNPNISEATINALYSQGEAEKPNYWILQGLARNPALPKNLMIKLATHPNYSVLQELASNSAATQETLDVLTGRARTIIEQQSRASEPSAYDINHANEILSRIEANRRPKIDNNG